MAPKKKKSKKKRQQEKEQFFGKPYPQILLQGDKAFSRGDYREAVQCYQVAFKQPKPAEENDVIQLKLFNTYLERAGELRRKEMPVEAAAMEQQAVGAIPGITKMDRDSMIRYLKLCTPGDAFDEFMKYCEVHGAQPELERVLADTLVYSKEWKIVGKFDNASPLKMLLRDIPVMKRAVKQMDGGQWEKAMNIMKPLPRSSPFSHFRMFCRAMTALYTGNDAEMEKSLSMIPQYSILWPVGRTMIAGQAEVRKGNAPDAFITRQASPVSVSMAPSAAKNLVESLWDGPFEIKKLISSLINLKKTRNYSAKMANTIKKIAEFISPGDMDKSVIYILEAIISPDIFEKREFLEMIRTLAGAARADIILCKYSVFMMADPLSSAKNLFKFIEKDFESPGEQKIAKAMVIAHLVFHLRRNLHHYSFYREPHKIRDFFGITSIEKTAALLQMIAMGINLDPMNRELYDLADELQPISRNSKNILEKILETMVKTWPGDPEPCLRLASLYHSKNAYRKAEAILEKATEIAPHDSRVMDQHVVSLLIAGDKNAKNRRFHLAWPDMERASRFDAPRCRLLVSAKEIFYKIVESSEVRESDIEQAMEEFTLTERIKILIMVAENLDSRITVKKTALKKGFKKIVQKHLKQRDTLASIDLLGLLSPLPREWRQLFNRLSPIQIDKDIASLLVADMDDAHLFALIHMADYQDGYEIILGELKKRLKGRTGNKGSGHLDPDTTLLKFYQITLHNLLNNSIYNYNDYVDIVEDVDPETEKRLRDAAIKLSKTARGPLKIALERFDFEVLYSPFGSPFGGMPPHLFPGIFDDDFEDDEWDDNSLDRDEWDSDDMDDEMSDIEEEFFNSLFGGDLPSPLDLGKKKGKGAFPPGSLPFPPDMPLDPFSINIVASVIRDMLKSPGAAQIRSMMDNLLKEMENVVIMEGLKGMTDAAIKKERKKILKKKDLKALCDLINKCYKSEASSKLSREAKALFIQ
ncbi:MAG: tetratricopeptide repeat protein [Desulfamplus sp.]|nr:tetratricopeptide repeat protein [Desulfamplus sp.]